MPRVRRASSLTYAALLCLCACGTAQSGTGNGDMRDGGANAGTGGAHSGGTGGHGGAGHGGSAGDRDAAAVEADASTAHDASTGDGGSPFDGDAAVACNDPTTFDSFDRSCQKDDDCVLVQRQINCCGTETVSAVRFDAVDAYMTAAGICTARFPLCGCAQSATLADDQSSADDTHPYALASCVSGTCRSSFNKSAKTTTCGPNNLTCDALTEICVRRAPVGPAIVYECKPLPVTCNERRNCACVSAGVCTGGYSVCRDEGPNTVGCDCPLCE